MDLRRAALRVAIGIVAVIGLSVGPVAALNTGAGGGGGSGVVQCDYGPFHNTAVIQYDDVPNKKLWDNARRYAKIAIGNCNLHGRHVRETAGEIRAHALGEDAPFNWNPGPTIDIAGSGTDPQEDTYGYLMDPIHGEYGVPGGSSTRGGGS